MSFIAQTLKPIFVTVVLLPRGRASTESSEMTKEDGMTGQTPIPVMDVEKQPKILVVDDDAAARATLSGSAEG